MSSTAGTVPARGSGRRYVTGLEAWALEMETTLAKTVECADQGMGHLEEQLAAGTLGIAAAGTGTCGAGQGGRDAASLSGLRAAPDPQGARPPAHGGDAVRAGEDSAHVGLVCAL